MDLRLRIVALVAIGILFLIVLDLVRRRRLLERYALLWLGSALALIALAAWGGLLEAVSSAIGVATPSNALFVAAFGFVLVLLLHFSIAVSRLTDQSKILAQRLAILEERKRELEARAGRARGRAGHPPGTDARPRTGAEATPTSSSSVPASSASPSPGRWPPATARCVCRARARGPGRPRPDLAQHRRDPRRRATTRPVR